jgi:predicted porin
MKKSLLALAAMGAFAGAAQAQSSVTVYGILDVGFGSASQRAANSSSAADNPINTGATNNTGVLNTNSAGFGDSYQSTSRLGFRGTEDLGGGLTAFFTIETSVGPNSNTGVFGSTGTGNRQTFVGLRKKDIGEFAVGTQYTTIFKAAAATDPGQFNNMMGNVIYDKMIASAARAGTTVSPSTGTNPGNYILGNNAFAGNQDNTSFTVRNNNMLSVTTANFGGFVGNAFYALNGNTTNASSAAGGGYSSGVTDNSGWGIGANFTWQKLLVTANYQSFTSKSAYAISGTTDWYTTGTPLPGYYGGVSNSGTNVRDNQQYYAITYDFGIVKAYAQYVARKVLPSQGANTSDPLLNRTAQQIGVRGFATKTIEGWASVGNGKVNYFDTNSANIFGYQLGSNYWLSKRTNLYAIYGQQSTSNAVVANSNPTSYNASSYALGVRHTF